MIIIISYCYYYDYYYYRYFFYSVLPRERVRPAQLGLTGKPKKAAVDNLPNGEQDKAAAALETMHRKKARGYPCGGLLRCACSSRRTGFAE